MQRRFVDRICRAGQRLQYRTYEGLGHVEVVLAPESPLPRDLVSWTAARLDGRPQPPGCETVAS